MGPPFNTRRDMNRPNRTDNWPRKEEIESAMVLVGEALSKSGHVAGCCPLMQSRDC